MVVQHNMQAMNANRMLGVTSSSQQKATEKLSSGYQINRAADNAAGLAISEKMRKQIRGLDRASTNAQDGVSAVQTAEGALNEVHSMLQRLNELAVQAANGTNSESDRESIQDEIEELTTEIDRVSETTKFNETELLKGAHGVKTRIMKGHDAGIIGTFVDSVSYCTLTVDLSSGTTVVVAGQKYNIIAGSVRDEAEIGPANKDAQKARDRIQVIQDAIANVEDTDTESRVTINGTTYVRKLSADGETMIWTAGTGNEYTSDELKEKVVDGAKVVLELKGKDAETHIARDYSEKQANKTAFEVAELISSALKQANSIGVDDDQVGNVKTTVNGRTTYEFSDAEIKAFETNNAVEFHVDKGYATIPNTLSFNLHVGADADMGNKIIIDIDGMTTAGLGIHNLNVADDSGTAATYAIDAIGDALQVVSAQRASLGAIQNRLEHTIANLDNVVENTTESESRIRDTDMAEEMVEYSKNNILQQAGQSMLAQANQATQGVLSLLQ